jgi:hypothetical protein
MHGDKPHYYDGPPSVFEYDFNLKRFVVKDENFRNRLS